MACPTDCSTVVGACPIDFNPAAPQVMHLDLNSCFASVEQQANPLLRDKPIVVVHTVAPYGCILAPSVEAKLWGIKTGMTLAEGQSLCPWLIARRADPPKYRQVHRDIGELLNDYSSHVVSKSIDEFALQLPGINPRQIALEIKSRIQSDIGDYLRVSIGVSTNQILAKLASGLHKPNGFDIVDFYNYHDVYGRINLQDFCGINIRNELRLHRIGIFTALQFYSASIQTLHSAFGSILGRYWYNRLRGYELDDLSFIRRSFSQSYVLPHPLPYLGWRPILAKLISKAARRLRAHGVSASGIALSLRFADYTHWHTSHRLHTSLFSDADLLAAALSLYSSTSPSKSVKKIAFTCFGLIQDSAQLSCLVDTAKQKSLVTSLDQLNDRWGEYTVTYGSFLGSKGHVHDAIAFGK